MAADEIRTIAVGAEELRFLVEGDRPSIIGRAIGYNKLSVDLGGFREQFAPSSVNLSPDLVALFDHNTAYVLGRASAGTLNAAPDSDGVLMVAYPPETTWANDLRVSMERGDIRHMSFRFRCVADEWAYENGEVIRTVLEADVSEVSVVSMPAYPQTSAEARSAADAIRSAAIANPTAPAVAITPPAELREGKVLSAVNEAAIIAANEKIEEASTILEGVLSAVDPAYVDDDDDTDPADTGELEPDGSPDKGDTESGGAPRSDPDSGGAPRFVFAVGRMVGVKSAATTEKE